MSTTSTNDTDPTKHKKQDTINNILIIMIKMIFIIIIVKLIPKDIDTLQGITICIFTIGIVLTLFEIFVPEIVHPVRETFFLMVGMKILRL